MAVTVKIRNKDKLFSKLVQLAPEADAALTKVNAEAGAEMVTLAKNFVPKKSGMLASTIRMEPAQSGGFRVAAGGAATTKKVRGGKGKPYDYALAVEFGTKGHVVGGEFAGAQHPGTKAQPFFYPSFRIVRKKQKARATRAINSSIKKVAGK